MNKEGVRSRNVIVAVITVFLIGCCFLASCGNSDTFKLSDNQNDGHQRQAEYLEQNCEEILLSMEAVTDATANVTYDENGDCYNVTVDIEVTDDFTESEYETIEEALLKSYSAVDITVCKEN